MALAELRKITHNDLKEREDDEEDDDHGDLQNADMMVGAWDPMGKEDGDHGNVQNADMTVRAWDPMEKEDGEKEDGEVQNVDITTDDQLHQVHSGWRSLSLYTRLHSTFLGSDLFTGDLLRDEFLRWLLPPDPSDNHNIAYSAHRDGTAEWFIQGSRFNEWKSTGSFLWIRGKRALRLTFTVLRPPRA